MKRLAVLGIALGLAIVAGGSTAQAATQIGTLDNGSGVGTSPPACKVILGQTVGSCTYFVDAAIPGDTAPGGLASPVSGVITRWSFEVATSGGTSTVTPEVLSPSSPAVHTTKYTVVHVGATQPVPAKGGEPTFSDRIPVEKGDIFALGVTTVGTVGSIALLIGTDPGDDFLYSYPVLGLGDSLTVGLQLSKDQGLVANAFVEPDADNDGYGDETQDGCPQRADEHSACTAPSITESKSSGGALDFSADAAGTYAATIDKKLKGRESHGKCSTHAKRGKKCTAYKLAATRTGTYLTGANALSLKGKLKAGKYRATVTFTNAQKLSTVSTLNFTIKAKKKHKKK